MQTISIIAAFADNHVMGKDNRLPWDLPDDWANFKKVTAGKAFLMGRKSYESEDYLGSDYKNFILTSNTHLDLCANCFQVSSIDDFLSAVADEDEVFILGGGGVFEQALASGIVAKMYLTQIKGSPDGDTFFPKVNWEEWERIEHIFHPKDEQHAYDFYLNTYILK